MSPPGHPRRDSSINLDIRGSSLRSSQGISFNFTQPQPSTTLEDPIAELMKHVALGALCDSAERYDPPKCHEKTRVALLDTIHRWSQGHGDPNPVLWLHGPVGAGKSAIAQTLSEYWKAQFKLAASFFFARTADQRNSKQCLISTIAYQLTLSIPSIRPLIEQVILQDRALFDRNLQSQMIELIVRPLMSLRSEAAPTGFVIVIDGLDECCLDLPGQTHEEQQREILEAITLATQQTGFPLRFLIASRPERQIRNSFRSKSFADVTYSVVLDNTHDPEADILVFLECKFDKVRSENEYIEPSWPGEAAISTILQKSSGHFMYPAIVMRQLEQPRRDPRQLLQGILDIKPVACLEEQPLFELDALYLHIMQRVSDYSLPTVKSIFQFMCHAQDLLNKSPGDQYTAFWSWDYHSPASIEKYLFIEQGHSYVHLADLHSVLDIPPYAQSTSIPVRFIHASFSEFLTDPARSGPFSINRVEAYLHLQSLRLKHCFIESLNGYSNNHLPPFPPGTPRSYIFAIELRLGVRYYRSESVPAFPSNEIFAERLAALIGTNQVEFSRHVHDLGLSNLLTEGNDRNFRCAHVLCPSTYDVAYAHLYGYIKSCGVELDKYGLKEPDHEFLGHLETSGASTRGMSWTFQP